VSLREIDNPTLARLQAMPECAPIAGRPGRVPRKGHPIGHPDPALLGSGHGYSLEVSRHRKPPFPPDDNDCAATAEQQLATQLTGG
jgi:hypothetical protein